MEYVEQDSDHSSGLEDEPLATSTRSAGSRRDRQPVLSGEEEEDELYDVYSTNVPPKKEGKKHKRLGSASWTGRPSRQRSQYSSLNNANKPRKSTLIGVLLLICCLILVGIALIVLWQFDLLPFIRGPDGGIDVLPLISATPTSSVHLHIVKVYHVDEIYFDCSLTIENTVEPTLNPTTLPTTKPSPDPSVDPTCDPTLIPTTEPTTEPTYIPTTNPSKDPSSQPTYNPSSIPTSHPTVIPSIVPTEQPSLSPTRSPSTDPTQSPSLIPSTSPTMEPTLEPTLNPTYPPSPAPTNSPSRAPSNFPSAAPSKIPSTAPSREPTMEPTGGPSVNPTSNPTANPTSDPSIHPTCQPTTVPSTGVPTSRTPTASPSFVLSVSAVCKLFIKTHKKPFCS